MYYVVSSIKKKNEFYSIINEYIYIGEIKSELGESGYKRV